MRRFDTVYSVVLIYLSGHNGACAVSIYVICSATQSTAVGPGPCFVRPVFRQVPTIKETCIIATSSMRYFLIRLHVPQFNHAIDSNRKIRAKLMYQNCLEFLHSEKRGGMVYFYGCFPFSNSDSSSKLICVISHDHFQPDSSQFIICTTIRIRVIHTTKKNRQISYFKGRALAQIDVNKDLRNIQIQ